MTRSFAATIRETQIRQVFTYWLQRCPRGGIPSRLSIDPRTIPPQYLPNLFLYESEGQGRYHCRLMGTELADILGRDDTGRSFDEASDPPVAGGWMTLFARSLETGRPIYFRHKAMTKSGGMRLFSRILLPLASGPGLVDQIFGMALHEPLEKMATQDMHRHSIGRFAEVAIASGEDLFEYSHDRAAV